MHYSFLRVAMAVSISATSLLTPAMAYYENNPPFLFKDGPFLHAADVPLADSDVPLTIKSDMVEAYVGAKVYQLDLDGNKTMDFIAFISSKTASLHSAILIYLQKPKGGYRVISFNDAEAADIKDVVDIKKNGKWELILADDYAANRQRYIVYNVYRFKKLRLVNTDGGFKGFPKFVWFTHEKNDKNTIHLTPGNKRKHVRIKNRKISYRDIK